MSSLPEGKRVTPHPPFRNAQGGILEGAHFEIAGKRRMYNIFGRMHLNRLMGGREKGQY